MPENAINLLANNTRFEASDSFSFYKNDMLNVQGVLSTEAFNGENPYLTIEYDLKDPETGEASHHSLKYDMNDSNFFSTDVIIKLAASNAIANIQKNSLRYWNFKPHKNTLFIDSIVFGKESGFTNSWAHKEKVITDLSLKYGVMSSYTALFGALKIVDEKTKSTTLEKSIKTVSLDENIKISGIKARITVRTLTGKVLELNVFEDFLVETVKGLIQYSEGIPPDQQRLIFAGRQLEEGKSLDEYGIQDDCVLFLILRLRGDGGGSSNVGPPPKVGFLEIFRKEYTDKYSNKIEDKTKKFTYTRETIENLYNWVKDNFGFENIDHIVFKSEEIQLENLR